MKTKYQRLEYVFLAFLFNRNIYMQSESQRMTLPIRRDERSFTDVRNKLISNYLDDCRITK